MVCDADHRPRRARGWRQAGLTALLLLTGCTATVERIERLYNSHLTPDTPIDWWHQLEGGQIADQRPPPPGVDDPYPNLASVPERPTPTDPATRRALAGRLAAERDATHLQNAQDPLVLPIATAAPTAKKAPSRPAAPPPAPNPDVSTATFDAAAAKPASPAKAAADEPADIMPAGKEGSPVVFGSVVSGPIPAIPAAPPPIPALPGLPASTYAEAAPRPRPAAEITFPRDSAILSRSDDAALQALADRRAGGPIAVTAGGDGAGAGPAKQAAALDLALRRIQAIGSRLIAAGVPASQLHENAHADGRRGRATLVE